MNALTWDLTDEQDRQKAKQFFDALNRRVKKNVTVSVPNEAVLKKTILLEPYMHADFLATDLQYNPTKYFPNIHEPLSIDFEIEEKEVILYATRMTLLNGVLNHLQTWLLNAIAIEPEEVSLKRFHAREHPSDCFIQASPLDPRNLKVAIGAAMRASVLSFFPRFLSSFPLRCESSEINFLPWRQREKTKKKQQLLWLVISSLLLTSAGFASVQLYLSVCLYREKRTNEQLLFKTNFIQKKLKKLGVGAQSTALTLHQIYKAKSKSDRIKKQQKLVLSLSKELGK